MPTVKLPEPAATEQPHVANEEFAEAIGKVRDATTQLEVVANLGSQPPDRAHAESIAEALRRLSGDISQ